MFLHEVNLFPRPWLVRDLAEDPSNNCEDLAALFIRSLFIYSISAFSTKKSISVQGKPMKEKSINEFFTKNEKSHLIINSNANVKKSRGWLCFVYVPKY